MRWSCNEAYITIRWDTARWYARNSCEKRYPIVFIAVIDFMITKGQIHVCVRLKAEVGLVP